MVFRIYVEKKPGFDNEARALKSDINELLRISSIERVRIFNRYDVEGIDRGTLRLCGKYRVFRASGGCCFREASV